MLKIVYLVEHTYIGEVLIEIHEEMSELLDKQLYVLKKCFK